MSPAKTKRQAWLRGRFAETLSAWVLRLKGFRILARGFRVPVGEIDIIARRGNILAFIEVKARKSLDDALHALGPQQRRRIERTALAFLAQNHQLSTCDARYDLIVQSPRSWPRHLTGAWIQGA